MKDISRLETIIPAALEMIFRNIISIGTDTTNQVLDEAVKAVLVEKVLDHVDLGVVGIK